MVNKNVKKNDPAALLNEFQLNRQAALEAAQDRLEISRNKPRHNKNWREQLEIARKAKRGDE